MHHRVYKFHFDILPWHHIWSEAVLCVVLALLVFVMPADAAMKRFQERSLFMGTSEAGAVTSYKLSWRYMSPQPVGSVDMLFCIDPIPYHPCEIPPGFDASNAELIDQMGEVGFSIQSKSTNHIVLTRMPGAVTTYKSSYTLDNIKNPTDIETPFAVRLKSFSTPDLTGAQVDFGSIRAQVTDSIYIETQVPPMLIFCVAQQVADNCEGDNDTYFTDMGLLEPDSTLVAKSQMAVGTNATAGFVITANGTPPSAGINVIAPSVIPTLSTPGTNQFGINLTANTDPAIGNDPEGPWTNAVATADYSVPNRYKFVSGDIVAESPNVSLMRKFTVSYILNASDSLKAGQYTTTINYIASGRF